MIFLFYFILFYFKLEHDIELPLTTLKELLSMCGSTRENSQILKEVRILLFVKKKKKKVNVT